VSRLLAPFTPFTAEAIYQNLVRNVDQQAPESVHLTLFPTTNSAFVDERLMADTRLIMKVVSMGRAARAKTSTKVRQPVAEIYVKVRKAEEEEAVYRLRTQILDELNAKKVSVTQDESQLVTYSIKGRLNLLGPKYGRDVQDVVRELQQLDPSVVARRVRTGETIQAGKYSLVPEEIEVNTAETEGYATVREGDYLVAVDTRLSPELVEEGLARELVHRIQTMRKSADFRIEDYITIYFVAEPTVKAVIDKFASYIKQETLSKELVEGAGPSGSYSETMVVDGQKATIAVSRLR
jgi:isoleucyl-tRNA synthetase